MNNKTKIIQMKKISFIILGFAVAIMSGCSKSQFAKDNTDPDAVLSIPPEKELASGLLAIHSNSLDFFYDYHLAIRPWIQSFVGMSGNSSNTFTSPGNLNSRWNQFYLNVGANLVDVIHLIDIMPADKQAQYQFMRAATRIPLAYFAFYVSDVNGSIPYTNGFQARYTIPPNLTPTYNTQENLYDTLDAQLQASIAVLESTPSVEQVSPVGNDIYYQGDYTKWIKAANSLRLKIAMRLIKRSPAKATAIANAVLLDKVGPIDGLSSEWVFEGTNNFNPGGNNDPNNNGHIWAGEKYMVDFMRTAKDPRIRNIYRQSDINTKDIFDSAQAQGKLPAALIWDTTGYRGAWAAPNASATQPGYYFGPLNFSYKGSQISAYWTSHIQERMIYAQESSSPFGGGTAGTGYNYFPVITYADVCFMRAELKQRGLSNDPMTVKELYENGVTASITDYDKWANAAKVYQYTPLDAAEITTYLSMPGVAFDAANALEQICDQAFIDFYVNPNEAWALVKRTGYPSSTGKIMKLEDLSTGSSPVVMPRRYVITFPVLGDLNYQNAADAINAMKADPGFGEISDITGRVWWDMP